MHGESLLKATGGDGWLSEQRFRELYAAHYPLISVYVAAAWLALKAK